MSSFIIPPHECTETGAEMRRSWWKVSGKFKISLSHTQPLTVVTANLLSVGEPIYWLIVSKTHRVQKCFK